MSWVRIWVHLVFATKKREAFLSKLELRKKLYSHIRENAKSKDIWIDSVNGYSEHIHFLISLKREQTISKVAQLIKGESSFWINQNNLTKNKFIWQDDYWAVGVSESHLNRLRKYIRNQEEHHNRKSFNDEVQNLMDKYGWKQ